jgi:hypothetical protein
MNLLHIEALQEERCSIMTQFICFAISCLITLVYSGVEMDERIASYKAAIWDNIRDICTISPPIWVVMIAHWRTYLAIRVAQ